MSEEEKDEQATTEAEETPVEEAPAEEPAADSGEQAAEEEVEAPAEQDAPPAPADAAGDDEPEEALGPKQLRKRNRSTHTGEAGPQRSAEDRAAERTAARKAKAASRSRYRASQKAKKTAAGERGEGTPAAEREPGVQKTRQGIVTSAKADKTITVAVQSARRHPSYEKIIRRSNSLHAHDERNEAGEGDTVLVVETRPMSKTKRWRLVEVVEKAK